MFESLNIHGKTILMFSTCARIAVSIILQIGDNPISISEFSEKTRISMETLKSCLIKLSSEGLINYDTAVISVSSKQRIRLAIKAVNWGVSPKVACKALGWNEFEDFTEYTLIADGYRTLKHFRFKYGQRRYEIDILALQQPFVLSVDCKRWKRSWQKSATKKMVVSQVERTKALSSSLLFFLDRLDIKDWSRMSVFPIIVTLSETPFKIYHGTPVVPIASLQDFLNGPYLFSDEITKITVK